MRHGALPAVALGCTGTGLIAVGATLAPALSWLQVAIAGGGAASVVLAIAAIRLRVPAGGRRDALDTRLEVLEDLSWQLRDNEARYRDLLDSLDNVISRRDRSGRLTFVNRAFCKVFGVEAADVLGTTFEPTMLAEEAPAGTGCLRHRPCVWLMETAGGERWFSFEHHVVPGAHTFGEESGDEEAGAAEVQSVGRDVTEERAFAAELAEARDNAQAADRAKSRFLAAMSHEIRTPMNGIIGMSVLLEDTTLSAEQRTYTEAIAHSAKTLMVLIDEILDFSKIEAGKLVLDPVPFALDACVQGVVELIAPTAHDKGLELAWTVEPTLPSKVRGDQARVRQILLNLIGNAVKFTDRGGVLIGLELLENSERHVRVAIRIKDTGIGLAAGTIDRLFAEFGQADAPLAQRRGGTGLGLAISRRLAQAMGGNITVESEPNRGATFCVELELGAVDGVETVAAAAMAARAAAKGSSGCVLLAFDRLLERRALAKSLRALGVEVREADDPGSLEELQAAAAAGRPVDVVMVDAAGEVGEAVAALSRARALAPGVPVRGILLIDAVAKSSLKEFRDAGFQSYLVRPVRPQALLAQLGLIDASQGGGAARAGEVTVSGSGSGSGSGETGGGNAERIGGRSLEALGLRVLLAEDNAINALLALRMLEAAGCEVVRVEDGAEAVAAYVGSIAAGGRPFDIVLMDMHMPHMDGFQAAATIRAVAAERPGAGAVVPPLVALTANAFEDDRRQCLEAGLDDYLAKPFDKRDLALMISRWCMGREKERAGSSAA